MTKLCAHVQESSDATARTVAQASKDEAELAPAA